MSKSTEFTFGDDEFLLIANAIMRRETPLNQVYIPLTSMDDNFAANRLDSLGMILFFVWLAELFEIDDKEVTVFVEGEDFTVRALKIFVLGRCPKSFTMEYAKELASKCM